MDPEIQQFINQKQKNDKKSDVHHKASTAEEMVRLFQVALMWICLIVVIAVVLGWMYAPEVMLVLTASGLLIVWTTIMVGIFLLGLAKRFYFYIVPPPRQEIFFSPPIEENRRVHDDDEAVKKGVSSSNNKVVYKVTEGEIIEKTVRYMQDNRINSLNADNRYDVDRIRKFIDENEKSRPNRDEWVAALSTASDLFNVTTDSNGKKVFELKPVTLEDNLELNDVIHAIQFLTVKFTIHQKNLDNAGISRNYSETVLGQSSFESVSKDLKEVQESLEVLDIDGQLAEILRRERIGTDKNRILLKQLLHKYREPIEFIKSEKTEESFK